jgi:hypothetical protein
MIGDADPGTVILRADGSDRLLYVKGTAGGFFGSNLRLEDGFEPGIGGDGGAIRFDADCVFENCIFTGNRANEDGGAVSGHDPAGRGSQGVFRNCLFAGNQAYRWGGGAHAEEATAALVLENCTVTGNRATGNASAAGGGLYPYLGSMTVRNSIVFGNDATAQANYRSSGIAFAYSCADPLPGGAGNTNVAPGFVDAGSGYGLTHTLGDYHLAAASPLIGVGNDADVHTAVDLAGNPRVTGIVDMGAFEYTPPKGTIIMIR